MYVLCCCCPWQIDKERRETRSAAGDEMFRSKKKKSAGTNGARKRKEIDVDFENEVAAVVATGDGGTREQQEQTLPEGGDDVIMRDDTTGDGGDRQEAAGGEERSPEGEEDEEDEDALLARMRDRNAKRGKLKSAMTFSSKASSSTKKSVDDDAAIHTQSSAFGWLSFADDEVHKASASSSTKSSSKRQSRIKIRPNLLPSNVVMEDEDSGDSKPANSYTFEMLDALRKEQNVLLRSALAKEGEPEPQASESAAAGDVDMTEMEGATIVLEEEEQVEVQMRGSGDEEDEEFIPLHAKAMQSRKKRNRVTFGVHASGPKLSKSTEVDEPTDSGDGGKDDDDDPSRKWEEELMRRGGHHAPSTDMFRGQSTGGGRGSKKTYPTRKKVPNGSLSDVLTKLQRSFDAATFENDRAERELARIDAEVLLIEESVSKQRQELLTSSEEFEYFQVVEDYVKGLSFCLREKVREIDANEKEIANMRVANIRSIRDAEVKHACEIASKLVETGAIKNADVRGLRIFDAADGDAVLPVIFSSGLNNEVAEKLKQGFVDRTPAIQQEVTTLDVFADAVDDMNSIQHVYGRFQEWRSKFPEIYKNCYCDIALEKLYAPYVRAELLFWDPLSIAKPMDTGKAWGFASFEWFTVLRQHVSSSSKQPPSAESNGSISVDDGPTVAQIRDVVLAKVLDAITLYFDPFSALHTRSICVLLEEMAKYDGYMQHCAHALTSLVTAIASQFASESKLIPLIAVREKQVARGGAAQASIYEFAAYQIGRFNALLDNLLTFFVALPRDAAAGSSQTTGFRCVMQVLHQLLAFLSHCQRVQKILLVPQAMQTVTQLTASPYLQQLLASSSQEQELKHILALFAPFVAI